MKPFHLQLCKQFNVKAGDVPLRNKIGGTQRRGLLSREVVVETWDVPRTDTTIRRRHTMIFIDDKEPRHTVTDYGRIFMERVELPHTSYTLAETETMAWAALGSTLTDISYQFYRNVFLYYICNLMKPNWHSHQVFALLGTAELIQTSYVRVKSLDMWIKAIGSNISRLTSRQRIIETMRGTKRDSDAYSAALSPILFVPFGCDRDDGVFSLVRGSNQGFGEKGTVCPLVRGLPLTGAILHRILSNKSVLTGSTGINGIYYQRSFFLRMLFPSVFGPTNDMPSDDLFRRRPVQKGSLLGQAALRCETYFNTIQSTLTFAFSWLRTAHSLSLIHPELCLPSTDEWIPSEHPKLQVGAWHGAEWSSQPRHKPWAERVFDNLFDQYVRNNSAIKRNDGKYMGDANMYMGISDHVYSDLILQVSRMCDELKSNQDVTTQVSVLMDAVVAHGCRMLLTDPPDPPSDWLNMGADYDKCMAMARAIVCPNADFSIKATVEGCDPNAVRALAFHMISDPLMHLVTNARLYAPDEDLLDRVFGLHVHKREDLLYEWMYGSKAALFASKFPGLNPNCAVNASHGSDRRIADAILSSTRHAMYASQRTSSNLETTRQLLEYAVGTIGAQANIEGDYVTVLLPYYSDPHKKHKVILYQIEVCLIAMRLLDPIERMWRTSWGGRWLDAAVHEA